MAESLSTGLTVSQTVDRTHEYLNVLESTDLARYKATEGMLDGVFMVDPPDAHTWEIDTFYAGMALGRHLDSPFDPELQRRARLSRQAAAAHVVRQLVQGDVFPIEQFEEVVPSVLHTMAVIDDRVSPGQSHYHRLQAEMKDVASFAEVQPGNALTLRRSAEAYRLAHGNIRVYGQWMMRAARIDIRLNEL